MKKQIITISREWGSGGHVIAEKTAEKLGIPCYDTQLIEETAKKTGIPSDLIRQAEQRVTSSFLYNLVMSVNSERNYMEQIYQTQRQIILEKAQEGPCVIVGRGADFILKEEIPVLRVFIYSDKKNRIRRIRDHYEEYQTRPEDIEKEIARMDRDRAQHARMFNDRVWGDRSNYDLLLHAGFLGEELCSNILVHTYQAMQESSL